MQTPLISEGKHYAQVLPPTILALKSSILFPLLPLFCPNPSSLFLSFYFFLIYIHSYHVRTIQLSVTCHLVCNVLQTRYYSPFPLPLLFTFCFKKANMILFFSMLCFVTSFIHSFIIDDLWQPNFKNKGTITSTCEGD